MSDTDYDVELRPSYYQLLNLVEDLEKLSNKKYDIGYIESIAVEAGIKALLWTARALASRLKALADAVEGDASYIDFITTMEGTGDDSET